MSENPTVAPLVSIDKLTLTANVDEQKFFRWRELHQKDFLTVKQARTWYGVKLYENSVQLRDGTHVSWEPKLNLHHSIRVEFNPNREPLEAHAQETPLLPEEREDLTVPLLACLSWVRLSQLDIALDYLGYRVQDYETLYPRAEKKTWGVGYGAATSIQYGGDKAEVRLQLYNKHKDKRAKNTRILPVKDADLYGLVHPAKDIPWMRLEGSMRGKALLKPTLFSKLTVFHRGSYDPAKVQHARGNTQKVIDLASVNPSFLEVALDGELAPSERQVERRRQLLLSAVEQLRPDPSAVYRDALGDIREWLQLLLAPCASFHPKTRELLDS